MTHKIFTSNDRAMEEHGLDVKNRPYTNHRERMLFDFNTIASKPLKGRIAVWSGEIGSDSPLKARINGGRWVVTCECGGQENAEPSDPIMFCHECGNASTGGKSRPVIFPDENKRRKIEADLMKKKPRIPYEVPYFLPPSQQSAAGVGDRRDWSDDE